MESVRDYPVTVARSANAVGKTHAAARVAIWFYKCFPLSKVFIAAAPPEDNLRNLLWGEIGGIIRNHPSLFVGDRVTDLRIARHTESFLTGVTIPQSGTPEQREGRFSGKHAPHMLFVIDEGDAVPPEVYRGIDSCMSGGHARLLVLFNPRMESGPVYIKERDNLANVVELSAFRHPNVITGEDRIPGAVTREVTVQRLNEWSRELSEGEEPDAESFELPDYLAGATAQALNGQYDYEPLKPGWRKVTEPALSYMVLGRYPGQAENQLIAKAWIDAAVVRWKRWVKDHGEKPPEGISPVMGLDVAEMGSDENVAIFNYGGWVSRPLPWSGVDTLETSRRATELYRARRAERVEVDGTGVGAGVAPTMNDIGSRKPDGTDEDPRFRVRATGVKVGSSPTERSDLGEFNKLRDQLWWSVREWLRLDPAAMLPPDEKLLEELRIPTYATPKGKVVVMDKETMKKKLRRSPDRAEALILTRHDGARRVAPVYSTRRVNYQDVIGF